LKLQLDRRVLLEIAALFLGVALTLLVTPKLAIFVFVYVFVKSIRLLPLPQFGALTRAIILLLAFLSFNTILGFVAWALKIKLGGLVLVVAYSIIMAILMLIIPKQSDKPQGDRIQKREIFALVAALAILAVILLPIKDKPNGIVASRIITYGGDNISHLEFFNVIDKNEGYVQDDLFKLEHVLTAKLIPYPQGWHLNLSIVKDFVEQGIGPMSLDEFLLFYHVASGICFAIFVYLFFMLGLTIQDRIKGATRVAKYVSVSFLSALLFTGPFFAFFAFGFQTHLVATALFMVQLLILMATPEIKDRAQQKYLFYLALLIASGIAYVWLFLWPVAIVAVALFAINNLGLTIKNFYKEWAFIGLALLFASLGIGQVLYQVMFVYAANINEPGFILEPNNLLLISLMLIAYVFVLFAYKNDRIRMLGQITGVSVIFSLLVLAYQLYKVGEPRYFYYKSTFSFILLSFLLLAAALSMIISAVIKVLSKGSRFNQFTIFVALVLAGTSLVWTVSSKQFRLYVQAKPYGMSEELADAVLTIVKTNPKEGHRVIAIGSCNRESDIKAMRLAVALSNDPSLKQQNVIEAQVTSPHAQTVFKVIDDYMEVEENLTILSTDTGLQKKLSEFLGEDKVKRVRFVDLDYSKKVKTPEDCKHFLR